MWAGEELWHRLSFWTRLRSYKRWGNLGAEPSVGREGHPSLPVRREGDLCLLIKIGILPESLLYAGKLGTRAGVIEGALGGACVTMLLVLCLCLVFFT